MALWRNMVFNCKIFDKNGHLKKVIRSDEMVSEASHILLEQKSTKRTVKYIKNLREPKSITARGTKFYDMRCVVCDREFHPRHARSKYCSHECQKKMGLKKNN